MSNEDRIARVARALYVAAWQDPETPITVELGVINEGEDGERCHEVTALARPGA